MASSRRDKLVETALRLFRRHGFHATGIDRILAEAGVAKMTLYNHFRSKEALILAALRRHDERFRGWLARRVEQLAAEPRQRPLAVFDALDECVDGGDFHGCTFVNACAEYADLDNPIHAAAAEHKRLMLGYLRRLAADADARDPERLAHELMLLAEGAMAWAQTTGHRDATRRARTAATVLLERELSAAPEAGSGQDPCWRPAGRS